MQLLVLKLLYLLFTTKGTTEYFYTNDLCVLVVRAEARLGNAPRPNSVVIADATAVRAKGANGVRFVNEEIELRGVRKLPRANRGD